MLVNDNIAECGI